MSKNQELKLEEAQTQLADLTETLEREKVKITPEVERYIEENARMVHEKLHKEEPVYASDLEFIQNVFNWIDLPKVFRDEFASIEYLLEEAQKRELSVEQWHDLLELAYATNNFDISWIDENFEFKNNKIIHKNILHLDDNQRIKKIPEGLQARSLDLSNCNNLMLLPKGIEVQSLNIINCMNLTCLPKDIRISHNLNITSNLHPKVIEDARRLEKEQDFQLFIY